MGWRHCHRIKDVQVFMYRKWNPNFIQPAFVKNKQSAALYVDHMISKHNSASQGRSHSNNCRLVGSSFKSSLSCFQEPLDCILGITVGFTHCHAFADIWVCIQDIVTIELGCELDQLNLKF